jgi:DNA-binding IclR family transcriptional regulator
LSNFPVDSVEALHILLLLRRSPDTFWRSEALSQKLGIALDVVERKLVELTDAGVLVRGARTGAYRYAPDPLRTFADAFKLKGDK